MYTHVCVVVIYTCVLSPCACLVPRRSRPPSTMGLRGPLYGRHCCHVGFGRYALHCRDFDRAPVRKARQAAASGAAVSDVAAKAMPGPWGGGGFWSLGWGAFPPTTPRAPVPFHRRPPEPPGPPPSGGEVVHWRQPILWEAWEVTRWRI